MGSRSRRPPRPTVALTGRATGSSTPPSGMGEDAARSGRSMTAGYEVGSSVTVRALHQMPVEGPEGELHAHDYRIDVVVGRQALDERGMVCDLDVLRAALRGIADRIDGKDLEE